MASDDGTYIRLGTAVSDPSVAGELIVDLYKGLDLTIEPAGTGFSFEYSAHGHESLTLRSSRFRGRLAGDVPPSDDIVVQWLTRGTGRFDTTGRPVELEPGLPVPLSPERTFSFDLDDYDQRLVHIARPVVERVAVETGRGVPGALEFDIGVPPSSRSVRTWHDVVSLVAHTLRDDRAGEGGLVQAELGRLVAAALLEMYPQSGASTVAAARPRQLHVRLALEFVHAHAHEPVTTTTIAEAVGVGVRALQSAFRAELGTTPNEYVREVRLDRVREALLRSDPTVTTVRSVALTWGFAHHGRFSQAYARRFGELPRDTLARRG